MIAFAIFMAFISTSYGVSDGKMKFNQDFTILIFCLNTEWKKADLTNYESYPDPGGEECIKYNGCLWSGSFAFVDGKKPESWVEANNIISVNSKDASKYKLKTLRIKQGSKQIDAKVYDMCSDSDCDGCCTKNSKKSGFLIDMEKYTMKKFGSGSGTVDWQCLDC